MTCCLLCCATAGHEDKLWAQGHHQDACGRCRRCVTADLVLHVPCMHPRCTATTSCCIRSYCWFTLVLSQLATHALSLCCATCCCRHQADKGRQRAVAGDANTKPNSSHDSTHSSGAGRRNRVSSCCCGCRWCSAASDASTAHASNCSHHALLTWAQEVICL